MLHGALAVQQQQQQQAEMMALTPHQQQQQQMGQQQPFSSGATMSGSVFRRCHHLAEQQRIKGQAQGMKRPALDPSITEAKDCFQEGQPGIAAADFRHWNKLQVQALFAR
jgi:hypothetical protein